MVVEPAELSHGVEGKQDREGMQLPKATFSEELSREAGLSKCEMSHGTASAEEGTEPMGSRQGWT